MTEAQVAQKIDYLTSRLTSREGKYMRNLNRYANNGVRRDDLWSPYVSPQAYVTAAKGTDGIQTQLNVIKSCVNTLVSKISTANVRPFFNSVAGDYETRRVVNRLQNYADVWLDEQHAQPKSTLCFRDACVFDTGVMHVNAEEGRLERVSPWKYQVDPAEYETGYVTQVVKWEKYYPVVALDEITDNSKIKQQIEQNPQYQGRFANYWDLYNGYLYKLFDGMIVCEPLKLDYEQYNGLYRRPFVEIFYERPIKGYFTTALADDLYPIQRNIDAMIARVDQATRNAIIAMVMVPNGSGLSSQMLETGYKVYDYEAEFGKPEIVIGPTIDPQFMEILWKWVETAYENTGITMLSAQGKKPPDLDSGKALSTMEDIESDRFNTQLQQYTHFQVDVMRVAIDCFPKNKVIIERELEGDKVTWGDARKQRDAFRVQFTAADALSKDPEEKRQQIQFYLDNGWIERDVAMAYFPIPDQDAVENVMTASYRHVQRIIDKCVLEGEMDYDESVDLSMLFRETLKEVNVMSANGDKREYIDRAKKLLEKIQTQNEGIAKASEQPPPEPPPEPQKDQAYDAGQIAAMKEIVAAFEAGQLSQGAATAVLTASFPKLDPQSIQAMLAAQPVPQGGAVNGQ